MASPARRVVGLVLTVVLLAGACGDDTEPGTAPTPTEGTASSTPSSTPAEPGTTTPVLTDPVPVALAGTGTDAALDPASDELPSGPPPGDVPATVGDLTTWNPNMIELADGRLIVRGQLATDDPVETSSARLTPDGLGDPVVRSDVPIRLFLVDPATEGVIPLSGETAFHTLSNATGEHLYYEIPLTSRWTTTRPWCGSPPAGTVPATTPPTRCGRRRSRRPDHQLAAMYCVSQNS